MSDGPTKNTPAFERLRLERFELVNNVLAQRLSIMRRITGGLDATKDIDKECGYPKSITPETYQEMYDREGIARRVVAVLPEESWKHDPEVCDSEDTDNDTEFEKAWKTLAKKFNVYNFLLRADRLSGIGSFGIILLGIDDGKDLDQPVEGVQEDGTFKPTANGHKLLYLKTFAQAAVDIAEFETDVKNPRFGEPKKYNINFTRVDSATAATTTQQPTPTNKSSVHWTRVIHLADNRDSSDVFGIPRMQQVYNRLYDLRKVLSSSGEMFWKGGFPGLSLEVDPTINALGVEMDQDAIKEQMEEYQNGLRRYIALQGMSAKPLAPQVADPTNHFTVHMKAIATSLGVPWRVFLGTEEAQLAGEQDGAVWIERIKDRQVKYITPMVITPFVERLQGFGVLPPCNGAEEAQQTELDSSGEENDGGDTEEDTVGLIVNWPELHNPSQKDKADIAKVLADAMSVYLSSGGDALMQPKDFLVLVMGYTLKQAEAILKAAEEHAMENNPNDPESGLAGSPDGVPGSKFRPHAPAPEEPDPDPADVALERGQKAADIERTKAEAFAKRRAPARNEGGGNPNHDEQGRFASGEGGGGSAKVDLPSNPKKLTIDQAGKALSAMGYTLGKGSTDLKKMETAYAVTDKAGKTSQMSTKEIKKLVYGMEKNEALLDDGDDETNIVRNDYVAHLKQQIADLQAPGEEVAVLTARFDELLLLMTQQASLKPTPQAPQPIEIHLPEHPTPPQADPVKVDITLHQPAQPDKRVVPVKGADGKITEYRTETIPAKPK